MDKSEVKSTLKKAKAFVAKKDGKNALPLIRSVLKYDPENYSALVLEGAALQQQALYTQSLQSFKKATAVSPDQVLAWQGIVSNYELRDVKEHQDLIEAYRVISQFYEADDKPKHLDTTLKYVGQLQSQKLFEQCLRVLNRYIKSYGLNTKIAAVASSIMLQMPSLTAEDEKLFRLCLEQLHEDYMKKKLHEDIKESPTDEQYRKFFQILYKQSEFLKLETVCRDLHPRFNTFYYPLDYLCRLYVEHILSKDAVDLVPSFVEKLLKLYPSSSFGYFAQGKILYENGLFGDAIEWLTQGIASKFHVDAVSVLIKCYERIWDWENVEELCLKLANDVKADPKIGSTNSILFLVSLAHAYIQQSKYKEAHATIDKLPDDDTTNALKAIVLYKEGKTDEFLSLRKQLVEETPRVEICYAEIQLQNKDSEFLLELMNKYEEDFDVLLNAGILLLKYSYVDEAMETFHKCLSKYPTHPFLQFHLAALFVKEEENYETATKYLKSAYSTLPKPEIGMALSDLYFKTNQTEPNLELLRNATRKYKKLKSKWAWLRLGMLYMEMDDPVEAVVALQSAVRTDHSDCVIWETLGDAYFVRGSYDSSLRAFEFCVKQGAESTYPKLKIGVIKRHLGEEMESIATLSELDDYTPALVELAKTWLQIATKKAKEGLCISVVNAVNETIKFASKVISSPEEAVGLTIITEATTIGGELNSKTQFRVPTILLQSNGTQEEFEEVSLEELLKLGIRTAGSVMKNSTSRSLIAHQHFSLTKLYHKLYLLSVSAH